MKEEVKRWLEQAEADFKSAKYNLKGSLYSLASFLCQQAVEKALKALLIEQKSKFPKIHDLVRLARLANLPAELIEKCERLTYVYTDSRYPDTSTIRYTKKESEIDVEYAKEIIEWVKKRL